MYFNVLRVSDNGFWMMYVCKDKIKREVSNVYIFKYLCDN